MRNSFLDFYFNRTMLFEIILNRLVGLSCYHLSPSTDNIIFYHDNKIEMCTNVLHIKQKAIRILSDNPCIKFMDDIQCDSRYHILGELDHTLCSITKD